MSDSFLVIALVYSFSICLSLVVWLTGRESSPLAFALEQAPCFFPLQTSVWLQRCARR